MKKRHVFSSNDINIFIKIKYKNIQDRERNKWFNQWQTARKDRDRWQAIFVLETLEEPIPLFMHEFVRQEAARQSDSSLDSRTSARNPPRRRRDLRRDAYLSFSFRMDGGRFVFQSNSRFLTNPDRTFLVRRMNFWWTSVLFSMFLPLSIHLVFIVDNSTHNFDKFLFKTEL